METTGGTIEKESYLGTVGWLLFIVGNVILVSSLLYFFLYIPAFIASFVISIILISRGNVGSGVSLLLLTFIVPTILWFGVLAYNVSTGFEEAQQQKDQEQLEKQQDIKLQEVRIRNSGGYMYCEGKVRNNGSRAYDYIKVKVEWLDKNGDVIDTDWTYAVGGEDLGPNEAKSFKIMTESDNRMERGRYYIIE